MSDPRKCKKCGQVYPATTAYFWRIKQNKDGLDFVCKYCHSEKRRAEYRTRPDLREKCRRRASHWYMVNQAAVLLRHAERDEDERARHRFIRRRSTLRVAMRRALRAKGRSDE